MALKSDIRTGTGMLLYTIESGEGCWDGLWYRGCVLEITPVPPPARGVGPLGPDLANSILVGLRGRIADVFAQD